MKRKDPIEGKEIRMGKGIVLEPWCKACKQRSWGFHISDDGTPPPEDYVEGIRCVNCGSKKIEWQPAGYSRGEVIMKKGWKSRK